MSVPANGSSGGGDANGGAGVDPSSVHVAALGRVNMDLVTLILLLLLISAVTFLCTCAVKYCLDAVSAKATMNAAATPPPPFYPYPLHQPLATAPPQQQQQPVAGVARFARNPQPPQQQRPVAIEMHTMGRGREGDGGRLPGGSRYLPSAAAAQRTRNAG